EGERVAVLAEALRAACSIDNDDDRYRSSALIDLAPHLPAELLELAIDNAKSLDEECAAPAALAALLPEKLLNQALNATRYREDKEDGTRTAELLSEALDAACDLKDGEDRSRALVALAPHMPAELLGQALDAAHSIQDEEKSAAALVALTPYLPEDLVG